MVCFPVAGSVMSMTWYSWVWLSSPLEMLRREAEGTMYFALHAEGALLYAWGLDEDLFTSLKCQCTSVSEPPDENAHSELS